VREPTRKIVWIASYPKSGNTWLRFLTCNLLFGPIESAEKLDWLAPDLHELRGTVQLPAQRVMFKTHFPYSPALPLGKFTFAALYIVRDPADVLLSNYHYSKRTGAPGTIDPADFDRYVDDFIATQGDPRWLAMNMGTWEGNVRSWIEATDEFPVLQLRYEDLLADGAAAAAGICRFLGISRTPGQIEAALAGASFERLRAIEESDIRARRHGIFYKPYLQDSITAGLRFMRAGVGGEARRTLSDDQRRRFDAVFGAMRRRLNYC
jgi:hypothetical protein